MIYAGHAIVGQDWKEPKVCSPFSRIYYIVDGEGILTVNGQRIVLKKGSVWLVPAGMTFGYFCESSMEQLFFHLNVLCSDGTDLLYGVRQLYERKEQTGEIARVKGLYQSETMTDAIRLQGMLWETLAGFLEQAKLDGEELKEHSPLIGQMFESWHRIRSVRRHMCGRWHNSSMFRKAHSHAGSVQKPGFLRVNIWNGLSQGRPAECSCPRITASQRSRRSCIFPISFIFVNFSNVI